MGQQIQREAEAVNPHSESQSLQDLSDQVNDNNDEFAMEFDKK